MLANARLKLVAEKCPRLRLSNEEIQIQIEEEKGVKLGRYFMKEDKDMYSAQEEK